MESMQNFKTLTCTVFLIGACSSTVNGNGSGTDESGADARITGSQLDAGNPNPVDAGDQTTILSQGMGAPVVNANVNCRYGEQGSHAATSHFRVFPAASIGGSTITEALLPIEIAESPGGAQPATLRIHKLTGDILMGEFELLSEVPFDVYNQSLGEVKVPVNVVVGQGDSIVVEVSVVDGEQVRNLRFGHNLEAQTGKTYYASTDCGQALPVDLATLDNPFVQGATFAPNSWLFSLTIER